MLLASPSELNEFLHHVHERWSEIRYFYDPTEIFVGVCRENKISELRILVRSMLVWDEVVLKGK